MAEIVGEIVCGNCSSEVPLKKDNKGKFYYHCPCGQHFMRGPEGANTVLERAKIYGAEAPEKPVNVNVTKKEKPVKRNGPVPPKTVNVAPEAVDAVVDVAPVLPVVAESDESSSTFFGG